MSDDFFDSSIEENICNVEDKKNGYYHSDNYDNISKIESNPLKFNERKVESADENDIVRENNDSIQEHQFSQSSSKSEISEKSSIKDSISEQEEKTSDFDTVKFDLNKLKRESHIERSTESSRTGKNRSSTEEVYTVTSVTVDTANYSNNSRSTHYSSNSRSISKSISLKDIPSETKKDSNYKSCENLTIWEKWYVEKYKKEKENLEIKGKINLEKRRKNEEEKGKEERKKQTDKLKIKQWLGEKLQEERLKKGEIEKVAKEEKIRANAKNERKEKEKERAEIAVQKWIKQKDEISKQHSARSRIQADLAHREVLRHGMENAAAYDQWIKSHPISLSHKDKFSVAFSGQRMIRYQDPTRPPEASFKNHAPWIT